MNLFKMFVYGCFALLLIPLQSCNDDIDALQAQADSLKERVTALETAV